MYKKNDYIRYSTVGICKIEDIRKMNNPMNNELVFYYILKPVDNDLSTIYIPVDNEKLVSKMNKNLCKEEIDDIITSMKHNEISWDSDRNIRLDAYRKIVNGDDRKKIMELIDCIYSRREQLRESNKKLSSTDEQILKQAEKLIDSEFSFGLNIPREEVGKYIREKLTTH